MRLKFFIILVCCVIFSAASTFGEEKASGKTPSAVVPAETYTFDKVVEGVDVIHDFIVQNKGTAELEIKKVQPG